MPITVIPNPDSNIISVHQDSGRNIIVSGIAELNVIGVNNEARAIMPHNLLNGLQGGAGGEYYHLSSGEYNRLTTGQFVNTSETGQFYSALNPSGYITGVDLGEYVTGEVIRPSDTGLFYPATNPLGYITGFNSGDYAEISFVTGVSGHIQAQIELLDAETESYYLNSNPSGFITGYVVRPEETGVFYTVDNPSGYITGVDLGSYALKEVTIEIDTTTNRNLVLSDSFKYIRMTNAGAKTVTVPPQASVDWGNGSVITIRNAGAGALTFIEGSGVTIVDNTLEIDENGVTQLIRIAENTWDVI